ncbi:MAG: peptide-methionine (S)-S-oxide reductase MsrA [Nanoarchaeota archaeon]
MNKTKIAYFGAGCFWGVEYLFKKVPGITKTEVGYMGGKKPNPTYREVCNDGTGHAEIIKIIYDPALVTYKKLLELFFKCHNPTTIDRQGPDVGEQYRSAIFYTDKEQKKEAEDYLKVYEKEIGKKIVTEISQASEFWKAEEYHQDYYGKKGGQPYCHIMPKVNF